MAENLGEAWYELSVRDGELRSGVKRAEDQLRASAKAGGDAFATHVEQGTRRAGTSVEGLVSKVNQLRGKAPDELATALDRAAREADDATGAVRRLVEADDLDTAKARKYADQLNEIGIEADQTRADLLELAAADPRFDTPQLRHAADELDRVGREAKEGAAQLNQMKGVGADTHLERLGQEANEAADKLDKTAQKSDGLMGKLNGVKGVLAGLGIVIGTQQVLSFLGDTLEAASELDARTRGATRVLGEHIDVLHDFAATSAEAWGLSRREVFETGAVLHAQLTNLGFDARDAAGEVVDLQQRAADMAATFGGPVSGAVLAISAVLRGERDTIEKYGVSLKEADVNARIAAMGLDTSTDAAKKNAVAIASLDLVMEQTADTQGAFADSAGKADGELARTTASVKDLRAAIGEELQPVVTDFLMWVRSDGIPILQELVGVMKSLGDEDSAAGIPVIEQIEDSLNNLAGSGLVVRDQITGQFGDIAKAAHEMGAEYLDVRRQMNDIMEEMGVDHQTALGILVQQWEDSKDPRRKAALDAAWAAARAAADALIEERPRLRTAAAANAAIPSDEIEAKWAAARAGGYQSMVEYAKGLMDAQNEPQVAMDALMQIQESALTEQAEINRLLGQLGSSKLAAGLNDSRPEVRAAAEAARQAILDRLSALDAWSWGNNIGVGLGNGMDAAYGYVRTKAGKLAAAVRGQIGINSEPEDPRSPMRGITRWGGNAVDEFVDDMLREAAARSGDVRQVAARLTPSIGALMGGVGVAGTGTWHGDLDVRVHVDGPLDPAAARTVGEGIGSAIVNLPGITAYLRHEAAIG